MGNAKLQYFSVACVCLMLAGIHINSTAWFRMKLADHYEITDQYIKAIHIYDKVLRKNKVKKRLGAALLAKTNFERGYLAGKLGLVNLAIESYAAGAAYPGFDPGKYADGKDLFRAKLPAIGLMEAGKFDGAIKELQKLKKAYPDFEESEKYIAAARDLEKMGTGRDDSNFFFSIGDAYIGNRLFDEARAFYTKRILDYGVEPLTVLGYLHERYSKDESAKRNTWGDNIFVTIEDFETIGPQLGRWLGGSHGRINNHRITRQAAYKGVYSEFLDISYTQQGYDFWAKGMHIPLENSNLILGIRIYIKSDKPDAQYMGIEFVCPSQDTAGAFGSEVKRDMGGGWEEYRMEDLYGGAKSTASAPVRKWNIKGMCLSRVVLMNDHGISNKSYIDDIELYLVK